MMKRILAGVLLGLLVVASVSAYHLSYVRSEARRSRELATAARARISVGMTRRAALALLSDAWHHADCDGSGSLYEDLFFYGSHDVNLMGVVYLQSEPDRTLGEARVTFVSGMENYELWRFGRCTPLDLSRVSVW